jgi:hypothetical protein
MALFPSENCIIKTVTLQPGEPYNLPPDARLISATNINALTSTCPIPENLEEPADYVLMIGAPTDVDPENYYGDGRLYIQGYELNGVYTGFSTTFPNQGNPDSDLAAEGCYDTVAVGNALLTIPGVLAVNTANGLEYNSGSFSPENGCKCAWTVKIIPTIASALRIRLYTQAELGNPNPNTVYQYHLFYPYQSIIDQGYGWIPTPPAL